MFGQSYCLQLSLRLSNVFSVAYLVIVWKFEQVSKLFLKKVTKSVLEYCCVTILIQIMIKIWFRKFRRLTRESIGNCNIWAFEDGENFHYCLCHTFNSTVCFFISNYKKYYFKWVNIVLFKILEQCQKVWNM